MATVLTVLGLTFSYTAVAVLVPGEMPHTLLTRTAIWTVLVLAGHTVQVRLTRRSLAASWSIPASWWAAVLTAVAVISVAAATAFPPSGRTCVDVVRITVVGVLGEEVLFRGLIWNLVRGLASRDGAQGDRAALMATAILFAVSHVQYRGLPLTSAVVGQIGYTMLAGVALGWVRWRSGSLMPPVLLHATGNAALKLAEAVL